MSRMNRNCTFEGCTLIFRFVGVLFAIYIYIYVKTSSNMIREKGDENYVKIPLELTVW